MSVSAKLLPRQNLSSPLFPYISPLCPFLSQINFGYLEVIWNQRVECGGEILNLIICAKACHFVQLTHLNKFFLVFFLSQRYFQTYLSVVGVHIAVNFYKLLNLWTISIPFYLFLLKYKEILTELISFS